MYANFRTQMIAIVVLAGLLTVPAHAQPPLLNSSAPGTFGVRYLTDRAVITYTVERPADSDAETFKLRVRLLEEIRWGFLGRDKIPASELRWDGQQAVVDVPFGSERLHLGWAGEANLPPESAEIPVFVGDRKVGAMTARFDLEGMRASGEAPGIGPGVTNVRIELRETIDPNAVSLSVGDAAVERWRYAGGALEAREPVQIGRNARLSLRVNAQSLAASPVERIVISEIEPPSPVSRIPDDETPEGVLVEAEDYVHSTGTPVKVDPGSHYDEHGGASVYSFIGDGSSLTWEITVPESGLWDLYLRISSGDVGAWRSIAIDDATPEGLDLIELPGTGGWGHAAGEWWIVRVTGVEGQAPPLELGAGTHSLTMTALLTTHLNIDYLLLVPHGN